MIKEFSRIHKKSLIILIFIFVFALFLRLYNLTVIPIFADEAIYIRWAQVMRAEPTLRFLPLADGKQPLFMWLVIPFLKIISDPLISGRLVSVLSGMGTLLGVLILSWILFKSQKVSLISGLTYAISPFSIFFDRLALVDSMLAFFGVWTFIFAVLAVKKLRLDSAIMSGFFLGGALLTKSPAIFFALLLPTSIIFSKLPNKLGERFNRISVLVFLFTFTYLIAFGIYNILRLGPNFHMIGIRNKDYVYPLSHVFSSPLDPLRPFLDRSLEYLRILGPSVLVILIILGIFAGFKAKFKETILLFIWALLPILVVSEFSKTMTARYIYFSIPYLFILASLSLTLPFKSVFRKKLTFSFLVNSLLVVFVVLALFFDFQLLTDPQSADLPRSERSGYLEEWTAGYGIKEVANLIRQEYKNDPEKKIVVGTEGFFGTLPDGLQIYLNDLPAVTVIGVGLPIYEVPVQLSDSKNAGNKTYLVVNNSRFFGNPQDLVLKLLAVYGKAVQPNGFREALLFFEVSN